MSHNFFFFFTVVTVLPFSQLHYKRFFFPFAGQTELVELTLTLFSETLPAARTERLYLCFEPEFINVPHSF